MFLICPRFICDIDVSRIYPKFIPHHGFIWNIWNDLSRMTDESGIQLFILNISEIPRLGGRGWIFLYMGLSIGIWCRVPKEVEDARRPPFLQAGHPCFRSGPPALPRRVGHGRPG
jgi:hypothetical protein